MPSHSRHISFMINASLTLPGIFVLLPRSIMRNVSCRSPSSGEVTNGNRLVLLMHYRDIDSPRFVFPTRITDITLKNHYSKLVGCSSILFHDSRTFRRLSGVRSNRVVVRVNIFRKLIFSILMPCFWSRIQHCQLLVQIYTYHFICLSTSRKIWEITRIKWRYL